ncbi:MAG: hypothetical protein V1735_01950 [Nanoarchaeota archaeon]
MEAQFTIQTDAIKLSLLNAAKVFLISGMIIGLVYYLSTLVDLNVIVEVFNTEELPSTASLLNSFALAAGLFAMLTFILSMVSEGRRRWDFFPDRIEFEKSILFFSAGKQQLSLANVVSVTLDRDWVDLFLGTRSMVLGLSGLKQERMALAHVRKAASFLPFVQQLLNNYRAQQAAQVNVQQTINTTLGQLYGANTQ